MQTSMQTILFVLCLYLRLVCVKSADNDSPLQTNFLYIMFDDLRPELSVYGQLHMITPNFERLAKRSVIFDNAYAQIAVCNPSRDSLLTGLRPDTVGTYAFQGSFRPHLIFPTAIKRRNYFTAGFGKILHWDGPNNEVWTEHYGNDNNEWYNYQNWEWDHMNSTLMPDKYRPEETFPDYIYATKTINALRKMHADKSQYFMISMGFKMPHLAQHMPYKYYDAYRGMYHQGAVWNLTAEELTFPKTAPICEYRCCADRWFKYMKNEGSLPADRHEELEDPLSPVPLAVHRSLMWGYSAMITFADKQLGRILDVLDELNMWNNLTVILTADHGMHNGEKGLWEKWTLFDEATHVPLMIAHPLSPFKGQHYMEPVELIDIFPTVNDLLGIPFSRKKTYNNKGSRYTRKFVPLQGKSLAPIVLGHNYRYKSPHNPDNDYRGLGATVQTAPSDPSKMPVLNQTFAISQVWKCVPIPQLHFDPRTLTDPGRRRDRVWVDCDALTPNKNDEISAMGYSMRTREWRYTAWVHFDRKRFIPLWDEPIMVEELYDHRDEEHPGVLGHRETVNLASQPQFKDILEKLREQLMWFLSHEIVYKSEFEEPSESGQLGIRHDRKERLEEAAATSGAGADGGRGHKGIGRGGRRRRHTGGGEKNSKNQPKSLRGNIQ